MNRETLRYYERRGLLAEPSRSPGGHRVYPAEVITVLRVIKAAQRLGFTLDEVADLLEMGVTATAAVPMRACKRRRRSSSPRSSDRIADLGTFREYLADRPDAGCDDLTVCANTECCPLPFVQITTRRTQTGTSNGPTRSSPRRRRSSRLRRLLRRTDPRPARPRGSRCRRHRCDVRLRRYRVRSGRRCRRRRRPADPAAHRASSRRLRCPQDRPGRSTSPGPRRSDHRHGRRSPRGARAEMGSHQAIAMKTRGRRERGRGP